MKLEAFLSKIAMTDVAFAKQAKISIHALRKYKYGTRIPRRKNMIKIKKFSNNKVCEEDWYK